MARDTETLSCAAPVLTLELVTRLKCLHFLFFKIEAKITGALSKKMSHTDFQVLPLTFGLPW